MAARRKTKRAGSATDKYIQALRDQVSELQTQIRHTEEKLQGEQEHLKRVIEGAEREATDNKWYREAYQATTSAHEALKKEVCPKCRRPHAAMHGACPWCARDVGMTWAGRQRLLVGEAVKALRSGLDTPTVLDRVDTFLLSCVEEDCPKEAFVEPSNSSWSATWLLGGLGIAAIVGVGAYAWLSQLSKAVKAEKKA